MYKKSIGRFRSNYLKILICILFSNIFSIPNISAIGTVIFNDNMDEFPNNWISYSDYYNIRFSTSTYFVNDTMISPPVCIFAQQNSGVTPNNVYLERNINFNNYDILKLTLYCKCIYTMQSDFQIQYFINNSWYNATTTIQPNLEPWKKFGPYIISDKNITKIRIRGLFSSPYTGIAFDDIKLEKNSKPLFMYTQESGYENDVIEPNKGFGDTTVTWRVKYIDDDNDPPSYIKINIYKNGIPIPNSPFDMSYQGIYYSTGVICLFSKTLSKGEYSYSIETSDGELTNTFYGLGPNIIEPSISGYIKDPSNNPMSDVKVTLTGTMNKTTYSNYLGYYEFLDLKPGGNYNISPSSFTWYYFTPQEINYNNLEDNLTSQNFIRTNSSPVLQWTGEPEYIIDGINFIYGSTNTVFTYRIRYIDNENDPPKVGFPKLHIKKGNNEFPGSPFTMAICEENNNQYNKGIIYSFSTTLPIGLDYSYFIEAYDLYGGSYFTSNIIGPSVSNSLIPIIEWNHPKYFVSICGEEPVEFSLLYNDYYNIPPSEGYPKVIYQNLENSTKYSEVLEFKEKKENILIYRKSVFLKPGSYKYQYLIKNEKLPEIYSLQESSFSVTKRPFNIKSALTDSQSIFPSGVVKLSWSAFEPDGDTLIYKVYCGISPLEMKLVYTGNTNYCEINNLESGKYYYWQVEAIDQFGISAKSPIYSFETIKSVNNPFNYPNPFNPCREKTNIVFEMPTSGSAEIKIFSEFGDLCWHNIYENLPQGTNEIIFHGKNDEGNILYNGSYICVITKRYGNKKEKESCRLLIIK